jgi:hypothetical protein
MDVHLQKKTAIFILHPNVFSTILRVGWMLSLNLCGDVLNDLNPNISSQPVPTVENDVTPSLVTIGILKSNPAHDSHVTMRGHVVSILYGTT